MLYDGVEHTDHLTEYPLAFMLAGLGYLLVYSAENVLVPWFVRMLYNSKVRLTLDIFFVPQLRTGSEVIVIV